MTWWRRAWWIRANNGPHLRTARGRRRTWCAATRAVQETHVTETDRGGPDFSQQQPQQRRSAERWGSNATERQQTAAAAAATRKANATRPATATSIVAWPRWARSLRAGAHGQRCDAGPRDFARRLPPQCGRRALVHSIVPNLLAQIISSLTATLWFNGKLRIDVIEFQVYGYSIRIIMSEIRREPRSVADVTRSVFALDYMRVKRQSWHSKYMGSCLVYRRMTTPQRR